MASQAKQAVKDFLGQGGHRTTVQESVAPAVTNEAVKPHQHENVTTAVNREVHQDHHHTTVQPIHHREKLPEQHHHNALPVEHKEFHHGNESDTKAKLEAEAAKFKNTSTTHDTTHSTATAPTVEGERVHHHVHEHVQPVIHKETVQPHVVHTTVPVHETHHASAQHHGASTLPAKTLDEFTRAGGVLEGKAATEHGEYEGCPRPYNKSLQNERLEGDRDMHVGHHHDHMTDGSGLNQGHHHDPTNGSVGHTGHTGTTGTTGTSDYNNNTLGQTTSDASATGSGKKPGLLSRLNPRKDADGDGKTGFMD